MGWYKEYLQDLAEIKAEREANTFIFFFLAASFVSFIGLIILGFGIQWWGEERYLEAIGLFVVWVLLFVPTFRLFITAGGGYGIGCLGVIFFIIAIGCEIWGAIYVNDMGNNNKTPAKTSYLDAIDHINSNVELGLFYYDIANKFHDKKWV